MAHTSSRPGSPLAATFSLLVATTTTAQDAPVRFVPTEPMVRLAIQDAPALLAALPGTHFGRLLAEPDVAAAIEIARQNYVAKVTRWAQSVDRLEQLDPGKLDIETLLQRQVFDLDWRELHSGALFATRVPGSDYGVQSVLSVEPVAAIEGQLAQRFEQLANRLRAIAADANHAASVHVAADKIDGYPALVLTPRHPDADEFRYQPGGSWLLQLPGQFVGGSGKVEVAGKVGTAARPAPAIALAIGMRSYLDLLDGPGAADAQVAAVLQHLGLDVVRSFFWHLRPVGALLQDDIGFELTGRPGGVLGALLDGIAPSVDQPLPEHGLLQLRLTFDPATLFAALDGLLAQAGEPTLADLGLVDDLRTAWTGGLAFAVVRPAPGGLVPRLYASFGIADADAFARLMARLHAVPDLEPKAVTYEGQACTQLRIAGAPPALQPSYCLRDGVAHFAESGISLRAMLKAAADGAPPALDVGDAERPDGPGALLPGFDLRFDGAAIHRAIQELWLPIADTFLPMGGSMQPLVPLADMPDFEVVTAHLRPGRGVLRRSPERVVLSMSGTAGGPELHLLLAAYGPLLSGPMTNSWSWQTDALQYELAKAQLQRVHAAITRFRERTGKAPASFGELLAGGDLADASLLLLPGDENAEPVVHEGKELGRTSFLFLAAGQQVAVDGEQVAARVISRGTISWRRVVLADDGSIHDTWDDTMQVAVPEMVEEIVIEEAPK